ncbi:DUF2059 domain-containing protein [Ruegeria sp.]|uniref:DUF2059 domain-containing protein n=1 Tax=Ruegeria sp. TaxID=1879320 RepID=UPI003B598BAB
MRWLAGLLALCLWVLPVQAEEKVDRLLRALQLDQVIDILQDEGTTLGADVQEVFLENKGGPVFLAEVERIYDAEFMHDQIRDVFQDTLTETQLDRAILFFESDLGQTITSLEISARAALADETIEEMAEDAYKNGDRSSETYRLVDEYIQINNLVDENVKNSISADFHFFRGMSQGIGADEEELLAQLLDQKDRITEDTETWLYSFFLLAYRPLEDAEMRENIAFSRTETGKAINHALFESFDRMFDVIYFQLGQAVAGVLKSSEL